MNRVFVYGTLKRGGVWHARLMQDATFVGEEIVRDHALMPASMTIPAAIPRRGRIIRGELFDVTDATLADLDHLEKGYERRRVHVEFGTAWMYVSAYEAVDPWTGAVFEAFPFPTCVCVERRGLTHAWGCPWYVSP